MCRKLDPSKEHGLTSMHVDEDNNAGGQRPRKMVRFSDIANQFHPVIQRMEISSEEHLAAFFTAEEYATMRLRDRLATKYHGPGGRRDFELGLESRRDRFLRRKRINESCLSVLLEQELQSSGTSRKDSTALATVLRPFSVQSSQLAYWRAYDNMLQVFHDHEREIQRARDDDNGYGDHPDQESRDREDPTDRRAASPTSPMDLPSCCDSMDSTIKAMDIDPMVEEDKMVVEFLPPRTLMSRATAALPVMTVHDCEVLSRHESENLGCLDSPVPPLVDSVVGPVHYYHPLPTNPWMQRWIHQFSSPKNAPEPIHDVHWYLA